jgi:soluble lytic murein transglycosylase-like protein
MMAESGGNENVGTSSSGAIGLMQFMPDTAKGLGIDPTDPNQSIDGAAQYLSSLYKQFGDWKLAVAAYNAGEGNVRKYGGIPPFQETQNYVKKIFGGG